MRMGLDTIIAISGKQGLYKLVTQTKGGFIAESLNDKKRISADLRSNVSVLSEIAIYTLTEEVPLRDVLKKIQDKENSQKTTISHKASKDDLEEYLFNVLPDYDEDRVYASDIKKIIRWYNLLQVNGLLSLLDEGVEESDEEE